MLSGNRRFRTCSVALVSAIAIGVTATAADASPRNRGARRLARAASAFAKEGSARISGSIAIDVTTGTDAGQKISMPFSGSIDNRTKTGSFTFDPSGLGGPGMSGPVTEIFAGNALYMSTDAFGSQLRERLGGKHWLELDLSKLGAGTSQAQQTDPTSTLDALRGVSNDVQNLGHATIRDVDTTHYRATLDPAKALTHVPPAQRPRVQSALSQFGGNTIPIDVWLDDNGVPRRYAINMDVSKSGATVHVDESFDFYDFGTPVSVKVPAPDDVADFSQLQRLQQVGQAT